MPEFHFYHPIEVRYGDLDPQGHLNNAKYLTFMEQARIQYFKQLGLWEEESFLEIGIILADIHITFHKSVQFGQVVQVGARVTCLGNKSMEMAYVMEDSSTGELLADGTSVLVAYDYRNRQSVPISDGWRIIISTFDNLPVVMNE